MTPANRITRYLPDPDTVPAPRWSPPEPQEPERMPAAFWFVAGVVAGLAMAWVIGGGR